MLDLPTKTQFLNPRSPIGILKISSLFSITAAVSLHRLRLKRRYPCAALPPLAKRAAASNELHALVRLCLHRVLVISLFPPYRLCLIFRQPRLLSAFRISY